MEAAGAPVGEVVVVVEDPVLLVGRPRVRLAEDRLDVAAAVPVASRRQLGRLVGGVVGASLRQAADAVPGRCGSRAVADRDARLRQQRAALPSTRTVTVAASAATGANAQAAVVSAAASRPRTPVPLMDMTLLLLVDKPRRGRAARRWTTTAIRCRFAPLPMTSTARPRASARRAARRPSVPAAIVRPRRLSSARVALGARRALLPPR